ncbi:MAG: tyrosine-type recombinase/integrase [Myxococcales bacterium]|nr:tyrosine-type recombinase/integrase [Myxococcales bacterium]
MSVFAAFLAEKVADYIRLRRSLGYVFKVQAATLREFVRFVKVRRVRGPLTSNLAVAFVLTCNVTPAVRARRYSVLARFADYLAIFNVRTPILDPQAFPRPRSTPPARILDDEELARLLTAARSIKRPHALFGETLYTLIGVLASTGLRSGEALRLDRTDVDLTTGVLQVRQSKFRKDRLVPVHPSTCAQLRAYAAVRDNAFPRSSSAAAFFVSSRGHRLPRTTFGAAFRVARTMAGLATGRPRVLRPHDLRHRFATRRLADWYRDGVDVQAQLPVLAVYLGHVRYSDTAYYITGTPELLGLAAARAFAPGGEFR